VVAEVFAAPGSQRRQGLASKACCTHRRQESSPWLRRELNASTVALTRYVIRCFTKPRPTRSQLCPSIENRCLTDGSRGAKLGWGSRASFLPAAVYRNPLAYTARGSFMPGGTKTDKSGPPVTPPVPRRQHRPPLHAPRLRPPLTSKHPCSLHTHSLGYPPRCLTMRSDTFRFDAPKEGE